VTSELLIDLLSPNLQLIRLVLRASWMVRVVVLNPTVAVEAQGDRIVEVIRTACRLGLDMVALYVDSARLFAKAAVPVTPEKNLGSGFKIEWHGQCVLLVGAMISPHPWC
jgi:hypothetical protein